MHVIVRIRYGSIGAIRRWCGTGLVRSSAKALNKILYPSLRLSKGISINFSPKLCTQTLALNPIPNRCSTPPTPPTRVTSFHGNGSAIFLLAQFAVIAISKSSPKCSKLHLNPVHLYNYWRNYNPFVKNFSGRRRRRGRGRGCGCSFGRVRSEWLWASEQRFA